MERFVITSGCRCLSTSSKPISNKKGTNLLFVRRSFTSRAWSLTTLFSSTSRGVGESKALCLLLSQNTMGPYVVKNQSRMFWSRCQPSHLFSANRRPQISSTVYTYRNASTESKEPPPGSGENRTLPVWLRILVVSSVGGALYFLLRDAEHQKEISSEKTRYTEFTKAKLGGDWTLTDHHGKRRSSKEFHGNWVLIYFGFTHCPDICPEELEKLALIVKMFDEKKDMPNLQPLFITLDPERDSPSAIKEYCAEFKSPRLLGFTGTEEEIRDLAKKYRVYFGKGERDENNDYIVDHTIIIYLVNPRGEFVNYFGRSLEAEQISESISRHITKYNELEAKSLI